MCKDNKSLDNFYEAHYLKKDGTKSHSKVCKICYGKLVKKRKSGRNRQEYLDYQKKYQSTKGLEFRRKRFEWLNDLKRGPCEDCHTKYPPECMDFDHINPEEKLFAVSGGVVGGRSVKLVKAEVAKCRLLCANCHRIRTAKQQARGDRYY